MRRGPVELEASLLLSAFVGLLGASIYGYVGTLMARRVVQAPDGRLAMRMFAMWWLGLSVYTVITALPTAAAAFGFTNPALQATLTFVGLVPLLLALWGLLYYLVFIFTGRRRYLVPLGLLHLALLVFFTWLVVLMDPTGVDVRMWNVQLQYAHPLEGGLLFVALAAILGPVLLAALAYGTLFFRTDDRTSRYRIGMVSGAFVFWFGSSAIASALGVGDFVWWPIVTKFIGVVAALIVLAAYRPPPPVARALGISTVETA